MEPAFWLERWRTGQIGFHRTSVNPDLVEHEARFLAGGPHRVLVPLCGKSVDLPWLAGRGHEVVGVELAEQALRALLAEQLVPFTVRSGSGFTRFVAPPLDLWCGDLFEVDPAAISPITRVWDRASMVAVPPSTRDRYVATLRRLAPGATMLLNTMDYDPTAMSGPPFAVPLAEIRDRYGADHVELLAERDLLEAEPRWRALGHTWVTSVTCLVRL